MVEATSLMTLIKNTCHSVLILRMQQESMLFKYSGLLKEPCIVKGISHWTSKAVYMIQTLSVGCYMQHVHIVGSVATIN